MSYGRWPWLIPSLVVGESLHDRLASGPLPWRTALSIIREACSSLAEAHELGIVHRDLKPANLYLTADDVVKVLDFGIARVASSELDDGIELTRMGQTVGTLEYMAPEQIIGDTCDPRSDIYQLGILAYEMVTGVRPFAEATDSTSMITSLLTLTPPAPSPRMPSVALPADVDTLIMRCLARAPEHRFASVHALARAVEHAMLGPSPSMTRIPFRDAPTWIVALHPSPTLPHAYVGHDGTSPTLLEAMPMMLDVEPFPAWVEMPRLAEGTTSPGLALGSRIKPLPLDAEHQVRSRDIPRETVSPRSFLLRVVGWSVVLAGGGFAAGTALASLLG